MRKSSSKDSLGLGIKFKNSQLSIESGLECELQEGSL